MGKYKLEIKSRGIPVNPSHVEKSETVLLLDKDSSDWDAHPKKSAEEIAMKEISPFDRAR